MSIAILPQPTVDANGKELTVYFPPDHGAERTNENEQKRIGKFHAAWLWSNAPSNVMIPSGQRKLSPGAFPTNCAIINAQICLRDDNNYSTLQQSENSVQKGNYCKNDEQLVVPPPPPSLCSSVHPISTSPNQYINSSSKISSINGTNDDYVVIVTWNNFYTNATAQGNTTTSCYDVKWLQEWTYCNSDRRDKDDALHQRRLQREVSNKHTFLYKYRMSTQNNERSSSLDVEEEYDVVDNEAHQYLNNDDEKRGATRLARHEGLYHVSFDSIRSQKELQEDTDHAEDMLFSLMDAIFMDGAAIVTNCPAVDADEEDGPNTPVSVIGKAIAGSLSHGALYGEIFHVKSVPNANNVAYTSQFLCPHQDLVYYDSKPGLQLLHCNASSDIYVKGGNSILVDCMAAAHTLRELAPELFRVLVSCPATFVKEREGAQITYSIPHIVLKEDGSRGGRDSIYGEIVEVNWAPPFEGPLSLPFDMVMPYYKAYSAFELMLDNSIDIRERQQQDQLLDQSLQESLSRYAQEYTWEYRLQEGEMIVFNNMRLLHGRRSFQIHADNSNNNNDDADTGETTTTLTSSSSSSYGDDDDNDDNDSSIARIKFYNNKPYRHLIGAYTNIDDSLNSYRVLLRKKEILHQNASTEFHERIIPNVGNGTCNALP